MKKAPTTDPRVIDTGTMKIDDLLPADYNPRKISKEARRGLQKSIERFGLVQPIVWNKRTGMVVGGHQRLGIMREMGYTEVPVAIVDLSDHEERALNVTLNNRLIQGDFTPEFRDVLADVAALDKDLYEGLRLDTLDKVGRKMAGFDDDGTGGSVGGVEYKIIVECASDKEQADLLKKFRADGLKVKGLMV